MKVQSAINLIPAFTMAAFFTVYASSAAAAQLRPEAASSYEKYCRSSEARMRSELSAQRFLWTDSLPDKQKNGAARQLEKGNIFEHCVAGCESSGIPIPGGLIHDWVSIVFVPGTTLSQVLALAQNYNRASAIYSPHVVRSELLAHKNDDFRVFLRLKQTDFLTIVFDTQYAVRYFPLNARQAYSISRSIRIAQVENPGTQNERELPVGNDDGFLWRLNSYWRFEEKNGGVYVQCEAISLSRDIPTGLNWIVAPFIRDIPRNNLAFLLDATRKALLQKHA